MRTLGELVSDLSRRLTSIFVRDEEGRRPLFGCSEKFQTDPHWRDLLLFHEYFHGDSGAGVGANHQTGWTGLVIKLMHQNGASPKPRERENSVTELAAAACGEGCANKDEILRKKREYLFVTPPEIRSFEVISDAPQGSTQKKENQQAC
jgi:hypothetical protein